MRCTLWVAGILSACLVSPPNISVLRAQQAQLPAPEAWAALDRGEPEKAAAIFREELERSPDNAALLYGAGYAAFTLGRTDAAISFLKHSIDCNPRFVQAMVLLSQVAYQSADLDLAVSTLEKAATIAPRDRRIAQQLDQWHREAHRSNRLDTNTPRGSPCCARRHAEAIGDQVTFSSLRMAHRQGDNACRRRR
jgi:tetratricopeptide (TPR) repeat protein